MGNKGLDEVIDKLRNDKLYLEDNFGLFSIGIFGSYAKGTQTLESDIDFLVELKEPSFDLLAGLQIYLERRLNRPVEVIRKRKRLSKGFLRRIEKDIQYV